MGLKLEGDCKSLVIFTASDWMKFYIMLNKKTCKLFFTNCIMERIQKNYYNRDKYKKTTGTSAYIQGNMIREWMRGRTAMQKSA
ncbi:hypothetical protein GCM10020331_014830 [Ectobacillus funiculus]